MEKAFAINLKVNISFITRFLGALIGLCVFMAFVRGLIIYNTGDYAKDGLSMIFNMDLEQSLPTYVSAINLFIASALLALVTKFKRRNNDRYWMHWGFLSFGFLFLSIDESISLHELVVGSVVFELFNLEEQGHFGSSILIVSSAAISGLLFLNFILHLPGKTRTRFIVSGIIFVMGAAGMEALGGYIVSDGYQKVAYNLVVIIEESMEMTGVLLFIRALLYYIKENLVHGTSSLFQKVKKETDTIAPQKVEVLARETEHVAL